MNNEVNSINRYDDLLYENRAASINEYISNKYNLVHNELYNVALDKYIHTIVDSYVTNQFIYELFNIMAEIITNKDDKIIFNNLYNDRFKNDNDTKYINNCLVDISVSRISFFKHVFNLICDILDNIKKELTELTINANKIFNESILISDLRYNYNIYNGVLCYITYNTNGKIEIIYNYNICNQDLDNQDIENTINEYINKINKNIRILFKNLLCKLYKDFHNIIEIKNSEYWMPSKIKIISKIRPYKKFIIDLSKYWNDYQSNIEYDINNIKISKDNNMLDSELINLDYIKGTATLQSRTNDTIYNVSFKYLNENIPVSDEMTLNNSFMHKYNNLYN